MQTAAVYMLDTLADEATKRWAGVVTSSWSYLSAFGSALDCLILSGNDNDRPTTDQRTHPSASSLFLQLFRLLMIISGIFYLTSVKLQKPSV